MYLLDLGKIIATEIILRPIIKHFEIPIENLNIVNRAP